MPFDQYLLFSMQGVDEMAEKCLGIIIIIIIIIVHYVYCVYRDKSKN